MWRDVPGLYNVEISKQGELRMKGTERPIKGYVNTNGYVQVNVTRTNGSRSSITVHRLMAETFYNVVSDRKTVINHIDGNKSNNELTNLEVIAASKNIEHAYRMGLNGHSSLTADKVREIRKLREQNVPIRQVAKQFGISNSTVQSIFRRTTWKHVE